MKFDRASKLAVILLATTISPNAYSEEVVENIKSEPNGVVAGPSAPPSATTAEDPKAIWSLSLENDFVSNQDDNYTNGFRLSYISPEKGVPSWLEDTANFIPLLNTDGNKRWGLALGQSIYTPDDTSLVVPNPDDQPYAAWLYGSAMLFSDNDDTLDTFQLTLGIIGPSALGEEVQNGIHELWNYDEAQGWDSQLKDEPGIILSYDRKWRNVAEFSPFGFGFDITPGAGVNLGNVDTSATVSAIARFGRDLPSDYGPPLIKPGFSGSDFFMPQKDFGWYLFAGVQGSAVAQNIFLDGNTFRDSPSVDKEPLIGAVQAGIAFTFGDVRLSYTHVLRTDQFETQRDPDEYGAFNISYRF